MKLTNKIFPLLVSTLLVASLFIITGCSDDDDDVSGPSGDDPVQLTRDGWREFENTNWVEAKDLFKRAIDLGHNAADPYSGYGWSIFKNNDNLDDAIKYWNDGLDGKDGGTYDILVGLGFAASAQNRNSEAIELLNEVLEFSSNYEFKHFVSIDYKDLQWTIAYSYFKMAEYQLSYEWIQQLNPNFTIDDLSTMSGQTELLKELERISVIISG